jgi:hypothetical protein
MRFMLLTPSDSFRNVHTSRQYKKNIDSHPHHAGFSMHGAPHRPILENLESCHENYFSSALGLSFMDVDRRCADVFL